MIIPRDKLWHAIGGAVLALLVGAGLWMFVSHTVAIVCAIVAAGVAGVAKEFYDYFHPRAHTVEAADAAATLMGGLIVAILLLLLAMLTGCSVFNDRPLSVEAPATEKPIESPRPVPTNGDQWRREADALRKERDALAGDLAVKDQAISTADRRADEADLAAQVAWGRRIAFLVFGLAVVVTVLSFTPWGKIIPWWVGPMGLAGAVGILVAARIWQAVGLNLGWIALVLGGLAAIPLILMARRIGILGRIRAEFTGDIERAADLQPVEAAAVVAAAKLKAFTAEQCHGVHAMGQRLRGKKPKPAAHADALRRALAISVGDRELLPQTPGPLP